MLVAEPAHCKMLPMNSIIEEFQKLLPLVIEVKLLRLIIFAQTYTKFGISAALAGHYSKKTHN